MRATSESWAAHPRAWLCSVVFDGARAFEGVTPDLDLHCARVNASAKKLYLKPTVALSSWIEWRATDQALRKGCCTLHSTDVLGGERNALGAVARPGVDGVVPIDLRCADARARRASRSRCLLSAATLDTMPVDAKCGCLYPNNARCLFEAQARGFDNAVVCDMLGNVAELATSNIFMAKDGVVVYAGGEWDFSRRNHSPTRHRVVAPGNGVRWSRKV